MLIAKTSLQGDFEWHQFFDSKLSGNSLILSPNEQSALFSTRWVNPVEDHSSLVRVAVNSGAIISTTQFDDFVIQNLASTNDGSWIYATGKYYTGPRNYFQLIQYNLDAGVVEFSMRDWINDNVEGI